MQHTWTENAKRKDLEKRIEQVNSLIPALDSGSYSRITRGQLDSAARVLCFPGGLSELLEIGDFDKKKVLYRFARSLDGSAEGKYTTILYELLTRVKKAYQQSSSIQDKHI